MKEKKLIKLFFLFFIFSIFFTINQVSAEETYYYIDISLFPEGYAEFEINVENNGNLGGIAIELPILVCENEQIYTSDIRKKIKVTNIPDIQTLEGHIDLNKSCGGVGIAQPRNSPEDFTISFTYENSDWIFNPEDYPLDSYYMPILFSFPKIRTEDSASVSTKILLPPNMKTTNFSPYFVWEHPLNTQNDFNNISYIHNTRGNQETIFLDSHSHLTQGSSPQAIYIPLNFKRVGLLRNLFILFTIILALILIFVTYRIYKKETKVFEIIAVFGFFMITYQQIFVSNKPLGVTTLFDWMFNIFIVWALALFFIHIMYTRDGTNLTVCAVHPDTYQWFFTLPSGKYQDQETRKFGFLTYISITNKGTQDVSLASWRLYIKTVGKKWVGLKPISIPEPQIILGQSGQMKIWPVLGQKGVYHQGDTMIKAGSSISGFAYYISEFWGSDSWNLTLKEGKVKGKMEIKGVFGKKSSVEILFTEIPLEKAKQMVEGIDKVDSDATLIY